MTLREFLKLYNFRAIYHEKENTQIVRIITDFPNQWFEFGVNDWSYSDPTDEIISSVLREDILNREVSSCQYDDTNEVFAIHIEPEDIS